VPRHDDGRLLVAFYFIASRVPVIGNVQLGEGNNGEGHGRQHDDDEGQLNSPQLLCFMSESTYQKDNCVNGRAFARKHT
jgi:hypothetical protein